MTRGTHITTTVLRVRCDGTSHLLKKRKRKRNQRKEKEKKSKKRMRETCGRCTRTTTADHTGG